MKGDFLFSKINKMKFKSTSILLIKILIKKVYKNNKNKIRKQMN